MIVRGDDIPLSRWANGLGHTRELYVERDADGNPRWRVSMALCAGDGEFSHLPGVARSLLLLSGGMRIKFGDADWLDWQVLDPIKFDGATPVEYRSDAEVEDLGIMVWDGPAATLSVHELTEPLTVDPALHRGAVVVAGEVVAAAPDARPTRLAFRDAVICDSATTTQLRPYGPATVVVIAR